MIMAWAYYEVFSYNRLCDCTKMFLLNVVLLCANTFLSTLTVYTVCHSLLLSIIPLLTIEILSKRRAQIELHIKLSKRCLPPDVMMKWCDVVMAVSCEAGTCPGHPSAPRSSRLWRGKELLSGTDAAVEHWTTTGRSFTSYQTQLHQVEGGSRQISVCRALTVSAT